MKHDGLSDIRKVAIHRKRDAWRLFEISLTAKANLTHRRAAVYLGGYSIECKLKALVMEAYGVWTLDDLVKKLGVKERQIYTHGLESLGALVPWLWNSFKKSHAWKAFTQSVNQWRPSWRYDPKEPSETEARTFLESMDEVFRWFESNKG